MATLDERLEDEEYRHWVKAALCLHYTKNGLVPLADQKSQELHRDVLKQLRNNGNPSVNGICPNAIKNHNSRDIQCCVNCKAYLVEARRHLTGSVGLLLKNSEVTNLPNQHWQMAKLFMNAGQVRSNSDPSQTDISGILNFIDNCDLAKRAIQNTNNITQVRNTRNRILHSPDIKITEHDFSVTITKELIELLEDPRYLLNNGAAQDAVIKIKQVESSSFHISKNDEIQALKDMLVEHNKGIQGLDTVVRGINASLLDLKTKMNDSEETTGKEIGKVHRNLSRELEEQKTEIQTEIQKVQISIKCLKNKIKDDNELQNLMRDQVTEMLKVPFKDIKDQVQSQQQEFERLKKRLDSKEKKTTELQQERRGLKRPLDMEEKKTTVELGTLNTRVDNLESKMDDMQNLQEPLTTVSLEGSACAVRQRCSACKKAKRLQQTKLTNDFRLNMDQLSPEDLSEKWVCLIKLYPWPKEEMTKPQALCIASQLLKPDQIEVLYRITPRRMVIDELLKRVLRKKTQIDKFLNLLRDHVDTVEVLDRMIVQAKPTEEEIKECELRNKPCIHPRNHAITRGFMQEEDKESLLYLIKDIVTIDALNNGLLSRFFFSVVDHDRVCDCLKQLDLAHGASCLVETVEKCASGLGEKMENYASSIMSCFCDSLESWEETAVEAKRLRDKYCNTESAGTGRALIGNVLYSGVWRNIEGIKESVKRELGFDVAETKSGSILIRLCPLSAYSWENLKTNCLSGGIISVFKDIFFDEQIITWLNTNDSGLLVTIYSEESGVNKSAVDLDAILKLELISKDDDFPEALSEFDSDNPIERRIDILCEELDICDDLLAKMQKQELVPHDISDKLKQTSSRASKIRCLLKSISQPEKGYQLLKEHLRETNSYLFQELELRDKSKSHRKLVFQCEAQLKRASAGGPVKADDVRKDNQTEQELSLYDASTSMVKTTTRNRTSEDIDDTKTKSGFYKIALETEIQAEFPARMATVDERLKDEEYRHWVKAVLCLQYTKDGLVSFASKKSQDLHNVVLAQMRQSGNPSANGLCRTACIDFKKRTIKCCTNCNAFLVETKKYCTGTLNLTNFDIKDLHKQPWQLAKLFMNAGQDVTNTIHELTDLCGILNFVDYCTLAKMAILNPANINAVRDTRNRILHNPDMKITKDDFSKNITPALISLLQDPLYLLNDTAAQDAVIKIKQVESSSFHIGKNDEIQALKDMFADLVTGKCGINAKLLELKTKMKDSEETTGQEISKVYRNLSTELEEQKTEIQKVQISIECLKNKIKDDNELQNLMRDQVTEMLEVPFKDIKDQVQSQEQELERLKNSMDSVEKKTNELQQEQRGMKRRLDIEEMKTTVELGVLNTRVDKLDSKMDDMQNLPEPLTTVSLEDELELQQYLRDGYKETRLQVPTLPDC